MIKITDKTKCSGCCACANACDVDAIIMKTDNEGFWYPKILDSCIKCGKCETVCPIIDKPIAKEFDVKAYAAYNKNEDIRRKSSSGGVFTLLAEYILENDGVVFGAGFDEGCKKLKHIAVTTPEQLDKLQGSKYLQSDIGISYSLAKEYLEAGKKVLFTGTPCQINGLVKFLGKKYDNLFLQDLICHGVPSPLFWEMYLNEQEKKESTTVKKVDFRDKISGWNRYSVTFEFFSGVKSSKKFSNDRFMRIFLRNYCLRPSCYNCSFKGVNRASDITLGDFWGVEEVLPSLNDDKGISLVLVNSEKGQRLFDEIIEKCFVEQVDMETAILHNSAAKESMKMNRQRKTFFQDLGNMDFSKVLKKYGKLNKREFLINICFSIINGIFKKHKIQSKNM